MRHVIPPRAVAIAVLPSSALPVAAQAITFNFTGTVTVVDVPLLGEGFDFAVGQDVFGSYTFDSQAIDQDGSEVFGLYQNLIGFELSVPDANNYVAIASEGSSRGFIGVTNDEFTDPFTRDMYRVGMDTPGQNISGNIGIYSPTEISFILRDKQEADAFSSTALPLVPPSVSDFPDDFGGAIRLVGPGCCLHAFLGCIITNITASAMTATEQIESLTEAVNGLAISSGLANSLTSKLDSAKAQAGSQPRAAVGMLGAFINQVGALVRSGCLGFNDGQALITAAQNARAALLAA